jgi:hypothetical protein
MSGNGAKKVADVAVKAGKAIDWDGMAKMLVSEEARREFATLRRTFEDVNNQLQTKFSQVYRSCPVPSRSSGSSGLGLPDLAAPVSPQFLRPDPICYCARCRDTQ